MKKFFSEIDRKNFKPIFYLVMMAGHDGAYEPVTWEAEDGRFCKYDNNLDSYPEYSAELYDKETALRLIGQHILCHSQSDTVTKDKFHLLPVYTGFEDHAEVTGVGTNMAGNIVIRGAELLSLTR